MERTEIPNFDSETKCIICGEKMFYSPENLVHVCLREDHGILAYFEPDKCWFAASESTVVKLKEAGVKHHFIPRHVFENGGLDTNLVCDNKQDWKD